MDRVPSGSAARHERAWERVEELLGTIDPEFYRKLIDRYPGIRWTEMRICAMSRLDMSIKEMAATLNLSPITIMNQRSQTRKRLRLPREVSLAKAMHAL